MATNSIRGLINKGNDKSKKGIHSFYILMFKIVMLNNKSYKASRLKKWNTIY